MSLRGALNLPSANLYMVYIHPLHLLTRGYLFVTDSMGQSFSLLGTQRALEKKRLYSTVSK